MKRRCGFGLIFTGFSIVLPAILMAATAAGGTPALPDGTSGFQGMVRGTLISKAETGNSFVLKVEAVTRVWKGNKASDPNSLVGKEVTVVIDRESGRAEQFIKTLKELKAGDRVECEPFHKGGDVLTIVETLKKLGNDVPSGPDDKDAEIRRLRARVAELEKKLAEMEAQIRHLREEIQKAGPR